MNRFFFRLAPRLVSTCVFSCFVITFAAQQPPGQSAPPATSSTPGQSAPPSSTPGVTPNNPKATGSSGGAPVDSSKYKIGPGDVLNVRVWDEQAFTGPVTVHEDGKITLILVGDLDVKDKSPLEAQDIIAKALKQYVNKPLVTVTVQEVGSKRYFLDGLAARPGEYPLVTPTTVFEAISRAGGVNEFANTKKIYILRGSRQIRFNLHDVQRGKHMDQNVLLQAGDHIVIP